MAQVIDPFHRRLVEVFANDAETRMTHLCAGAFIRPTAAETGMVYAMEVGYLKALTTILEQCKQIEAEMYAPPKGEGGET